jgi:hypothetical protein
MGAFKKDLDDMYMEKAQELTEQEYGDWDFYDLTEAEKMRIYSRAVELVHENLIEEARLARERRQERNLPKVPQASEQAPTD